MSAKDQKLRQRIAKSQDGLELYAWTSYKGNSLELSYYSGVDANNPSGNKNIKAVKYIKAGRVRLTKTMTYDADDDVLTVITT